MHDDFLPLTLHASQYPSAEREALLMALRALQLPGKLLYQSPAQAQRWLDYHAAWSPSRTDSAVRGLYGKAFSAARALARDAGLVVGVGSGGGSKDADLLASLATVMGRTDADGLHYAPLDASAALAAEAALHVRQANAAVKLHPLVADLGTAPPLEPWLATLEAQRPRIVTCFGMLPNVDVEVFPQWLAGLVRPGDVLLVSANLSPSGMADDAPRILLQYDNPLARAWYTGALAELGLPARVYALDISARPLVLSAPLSLPAESAWQIAVRAALRETVPVMLHGEALRFPSGRRLEVFHSHRFTVAAAEAVLQAAGLAVHERWVGAAGEEGIFLCHCR